MINRQGSLDEVLAGRRWLRWRLHWPENLVLLLDGTGAVVAAAKTTGTGRRRNVVAAGLHGLLPGGEHLFEHWDWALLEGRTGPTLATARRSEPPRGVRSVLDAIYEVHTADHLVGTIGRQSYPDERVLTGSDGTVTRFACTDPMDYVASAATARDEQGVVIAEVIPGQRRTAIGSAPTDGLVSPLDALFVPNPAASSPALLLALFASVLDTQFRDQVPDTGNTGVPSIPPPGMSASAAGRMEQRRSHDAAHDDHIDEFSAKARRQGHEELATRIEQRRRRGEH